MDSFHSKGINNVECNLSSDRRTGVKWEPPLVDWMKLNVDAAIYAKKGVTRYGVVVRNHDGLVMAAGMA